MEGIRCSFVPFGAAGQYSQINDDCAIAFADELETNTV
jgi:hypothetical protein